MEFEINIDRKDYKAFLKAVQNYARTGNYDNKGLNKARAMNFGFGLVVGVILFAAFKLFGEKLHWPNLLTGAVLVFFFVIYYSQKYQNKMMPRHSGVLVGKHLFQFSESGVIDQAMLYETKASWQAFVSLQETDQHFFLLMDTCAGYIIPKSELASEQKTKEFRTLIESKVNA